MMVAICNDYLDCFYTEGNGIYSFGVRTEDSNVRDSRELDIHLFDEHLNHVSSHVLFVDFPTNKTDPSREIHLALRWLMENMEYTSWDNKEAAFVVVVGETWFTPFMMRL